MKVLLALLAPVWLLSVAWAQNQSFLLTQEVAKRLRLRAHVLWVDSTANLRVLNSREGIASLVRKAKEAHIHTIVLDVKAISGEVIYLSQIAPRLRQWGGVSLPEELDVLAEVIREANQVGIEVYASFNTFTEGHRAVGRGHAYERPEWRCVFIEPAYSLRLPDGTQIPLVQNSAEGVRVIVSGRLTPLQQARRILVLVNANQLVDGIVMGEALPAEGFALTEGNIAISFPSDWRERIFALLPLGRRVEFIVQTRFVPATEASSESAAVFVNPANPEVRTYEKSLIREVAERYAVAGVVLDRMRYPNLYADFSEWSRKRFEEEMGVRVQAWPQDVMGFSEVPGGNIVRGALWAQWHEWRARQIRNFLRELREELLALKPSLQIAAYVGAWYGNDYEVGRHWGSDLNPPPHGWHTPNFRLTGIAGYLDWLTVGCYYPLPEVADAQRYARSEGATVEAAAQLSLRAVRDSTWIYAGLYLLEYHRDEGRFRKAIRAALAHSQGLMIFDTVYLDDYGWWGVLAEELSPGFAPPHRYPRLLQTIRATRDTLQPR